MDFPWVGRVVWGGDAGAVLNAGDFASGGGG